MGGLTSTATSGTSENTEYVAESSLGRDDKTFSRQFKRAILRQQVAGVITPEEGSLLRKAVDNRKVIDNGRCFVQVLRRRCETIAGNMFDDLAEWWRVIVEWIVENWETVIRIAITLIIAIL